MDFMHCTTCGFLVQVNPTGTCLSCQAGFNGPKTDRYKPGDEKGILDKVVEDKYAFKEREEPGSSVSEHKDGDSFGKTESTSGSNSVKRRRKAQKKGP